MSKTSRFAVVATLLLAAGAARAQPSTLITYSGFLTDGAGAPVTSATTLTFRFYGGLADPAAIGSEVVGVVPNSEGYFSVLLGSGYTVTLAGNPVWDQLFANPVFMSIQVQGDAQEMSPRVPLSSVPSAMTVAWGGVTGFPPSSCSGTTPYVTGVATNGVVTCGAAPDGSITAADLAAGAVNSTAILDGTIAAADLAAGSVSGGTGGVIADGSITAADLATGSVTSTAILDGTITFADMGTNGCTANQIAKRNSTNTAWICAGDLDSGGDITSVAAGSGLSGGGISGAVTLSLDSAASPTFAGLTVTGTLAAGLEVVQVTDTVSDLSIATSHYAGATGYIFVNTVSCPAGKRVLGGGCDIAGVTVSQTHVGITRPTPAGDGWTCYATTSTNTGVTATAYAICARIGP